MSYNYFNYFEDLPQELFMSTEEIVMANQAAVTKVIEKLGGQAETARKLKARLRDCGREDEASKMAIGKIWSWEKRDKSGIPIKFILDVEALSGIPREELRPDVPWRGL